MKEVAVKLITFIHKVFAIRIKLAARPKAERSTDRVTDGNVELLERPYEHASCCCLAMGTGDGD
ncbi:hypothetical protein D3C72_1094290 [compost metagenome]